MERVCYGEATARLLEAVPELEDAYRRELQALGSAEAVGSYVVYEDLLVPFIERALRESDTRTLTRVFGLLESLASSDDARLHSLVGTGVCAHFLYDPDRVRRLRRFMGRRTKQILKQVRSG